MTYTIPPNSAGPLIPGRHAAVLRAMFVQMPDNKSTMPPGPDDAAAFEHAARLREVDRRFRETRTPSGLLRDLAEGWAALGGKT